MKFKIIYLIYISIIATLVSQLPTFVENKSSQYFLIVWILPIIGLLFKSHFRLNRILNNLIISFVLLVFFVNYMAMFDSVDFLKSPHLNNIYKSFFVLIISYNYAFFVDFDTFSRDLGWISLVLGIILCLGVYNHSFAEDFDVTNRIYAYAAKNSISQIILSCLVLSFFLISSRSRVIGIMLRITKVVFILFGITLLFLLKSRATILGLSFFFFIILNRKEIQPKIFLIVMLFSTVAVFFYNSQIRNIFFYSIILAGRDINDLNDATSGRVDFFTDYPKLFLNRPFTGHGYIFSESFPLSVLLDYGLIGGALVFYIVAILCFLCTTMWGYRNNNLVASFVVIVAIYLFNSIFEQQAPFGPGAKNFLLWLVLGFVLRYKETILELTPIEKPKPRTNKDFNFD